MLHAFLGVEYADECCWVEQEGGTGCWSISETSQAVHCTPGSTDREWEVGVGTYDENSGVLLWQHELS